jgi:hypothetical protein
MRARTLALTLVLGLAACKGSSGPATAFDVTIAPSGSAFQYVKSATLTVALEGGAFGPDSTSSPADWVTRTVANGQLVITFGAGYQFGGDIEFLLVPDGLPAAGANFDFTVLGYDASGAVIASGVLNGQHLDSGQRPTVHLSLGCLDQASCTPPDGGLSDAPPPPPTAAAAASFTLAGAAGGDPLVAGISQALVCRFHAPAHPGDPAAGDLVVSLPAAGGLFTAEPSYGRVLVYYGAGRSWSGALPLAAPSLTFVGSAKSEQLGGALACADLDGDGRDDLIIGAITAEAPLVDGGIADGGKPLGKTPDGGLAHGGRVYVIRNVADQGQTVSLDLPDDGGVARASVSVIEDAEPGAMAGTALTTARLFGATPALVIGAPKAGGGAGAIYLVEAAAVPGGQHVDLATAARQVFVGADSTSNLGAALAAGNLTVAGGTTDDLAMAAPGAVTSAGTGAVYVLSAAQAAGADAGALTLGGLLTIEGPAGSQFASALAIGDLDQDNIRDLLIGAPRGSSAAIASAGVIYLLNGGASFFSQASPVNLAATPPPAGLRAVIGGPEGTSELGASFTIVTPGTGTTAKGNLWAGAPGAGHNAGMAILLAGSDALPRDVNLGDPAARAFTVVGVTADPGGDRLGAAVCGGSLQDPTVNTIADLIVVAPQVHSGSVVIGTLYGFLDGTAH